MLMYRLFQFNFSFIQCSQSEKIFIYVSFLILKLTWNEENEFLARYNIHY